MKIKNLVIVFMITVGFFFTSCNENDLLVEPEKFVPQKEVLQKDHSGQYGTGTAPEETKDNELERDTAEAFYNDKAKKTTGETKVTVDYSADTELPIAINAIGCFREGVTLIAHNPDSDDMFFYGNDQFRITWYKNGEHLSDNQPNLDCVCDGEYIVAITDNFTGRKSKATIKVTGTGCQQNSDS